MFGNEFGVKANGSPLVGSASLPMSTRDDGQLAIWQSMQRNSK